MEQPSKSQTENNQPVIGAQCSRPELIPGKTYTRNNYPGEILSRSFESYTREQASGRSEQILKKDEKPTKESKPQTIVEPSKTLMDKLEKEGMDKVAKLWQTGEQINSDKLIDIMQKGSEEFIKNTGRNMSYSEMRGLYG
jgi:hypothetical protein